MTGMFYSLEEVIEKLGKSEDEIKQLVKDGKLREFRDGSKQLFKIEEVESLLGDTSQLDAASDSLEVELMPDETGQIPFKAKDKKSDADMAELTGADTSVGTTGVSILGDTDDEFKLTDDTKGETQADESVAELGDLDADINLDSVGSGSGLLDLSLQADDTSLGAVLDDILPAAGEAGAAALDVGEDASVAEEADKIFEQTEPGAVMPMAEPMQVMSMYAEPEPDAVSNACGFSLFLPLAAVIYAMIVVFAGFRGIAPAILRSAEGIIWHIVIGLAVMVVGIIGIGALLGGGKGRKSK